MKPVIFLMGPTASGKTALAVELVSRLPSRLISVDSAMVYRGMDIGSAKPDRKTLTKAPHELIDIVDPAQTFDASQFRTLALQAIEDSFRAGRVPILVGGTMLYFQVLEYGMAKLPGGDPSLRAQITQQADQHGWPALHAQLAVVDKVSAARIHAHDTQRIQRALEVYQLTGRPLSEHQQQTQTNAFPYAITKIVVSPNSRAVLHERIALRFDEMLAQGFVDEVSALKSRGDLSLRHSSMRMVGYRQIWEYLAGKYDSAQMREKGIAASRQVAKRQYTWLRRLGRDASWYDSDDPQLVGRVLAQCS